MKVYVLFSCNGNPYGDDCDVINKIFASREAAEGYVMEDPLSENFGKVELKDCHGATWYYFMEYPAYRIEEHCVED